MQMKNYKTKEKSIISHMPTTEKNELLEAKK